jgi:hypothetical protein
MWVVKMARQAAKEVVGMSIFEYALISCIITTATLSAMAALGIQFLKLVAV